MSIAKSKFVILKATEGGWTYLSEWPQPLEPTEWSASPTSALLFDEYDQAYKELTRVYEDYDHKDRFTLPEGTYKLDTVIVLVDSDED